jgi:hypothetical protein
MSLYLNIFINFSFNFNDHGLLIFESKLIFIFLLFEVNFLLSKKVTFIEKDSREDYNASIFNK